MLCSPETEWQSVQLLEALGGLAGVGHQEQHKISGHPAGRGVVELQDVQERRQGRERRYGLCSRHTAVDRGRSVYD